MVRFKLIVMWFIEPELIYDISGMQVVLVSGILDKLNWYPRSAGGGRLTARTHPNMINSYRYIRKAESKRKLTFHRCRWTKQGDTITYRTGTRHVVASGRLKFAPPGKLIIWRILKPIAFKLFLGTGQAWWKMERVPTRPTIFGKIPSQVETRVH